MINIIDNIFGDIFENYPTKYIGNKSYLKVDEDRRIEVSFYNTRSSDSYDSIKLVLYHKDRGPLHTQIVKFSDIFSSIRDLTHPNKIGKHIWNDCGKYSWYGKPTNQDIEAMQEVLISYIELWQ